jgi:uncharacterized protein (TIGR03435 family)
MSDTPDAELLEQFARKHSEAAFAELVERHLGLVYSAAFRKTENSQHAEEIAQAVFIILARKSGSLAPKTVLPGWLYHTALLTAANFNRAELRRIRREQEAFMQSTMNESATDALWHELSPLLDDAVASLRTSDRDAIVLRFFENKNFTEVGATLGVSQEATRKRVNRALEKLRKFFNKRGVVSTTAVIAGAISSNSVQATPAGLSKNISAVALAKGAAASTSTLTFVKGTLKIMAWTKAKTAITVGIGILLAAGTTTVTVKEIQGREYDNSWRTQDIDAMFKKVDQVPPQVRILPSKFRPRYGHPDGDWTTIHGKTIGVGVPVLSVVLAAYDCPFPNRVIYGTNLPGGRYDFIANLADGNQEALQQMLKQKLGVVAKWETVETNALFLTVKIPNAPGLRPTTQSHPAEGFFVATSWAFVDQPLTKLASFLDGFSDIPVVDRTGLTGSFDFRLKWNETRTQQTQGIPDSMKEALVNQLGLELVPGTTPVKMKMLVVERAEN